MFNIATLFNRRILYLFRGHKNLHKESRNSLFSNVNIQHMARVHTWMFYLIAYIGLPIGIMLTVFFASFVALAPISLLMGWM